MRETVTITHVYANKVWCESDLMGDKHVVIQSEAPGAEPFTWCTFRYDHRYTGNAMQRRSAEAVAKMMGADDPVEWKMRVPAQLVPKTPETLDESLERTIREINAEIEPEAHAIQAPTGMPPRAQTAQEKREGVEALASKVGVYYGDGKVSLGAPLYAFTPAELAEFASRLAKQPASADDLRRMFVDGAKWWEYTKTGGTMWPSDQEKAWHASEDKVRRMIAASAEQGGDSDDTRPAA